MALAEEDVILKFISQGYEELIKEVLEADKGIESLQKTVSQTDTVASRAAQGLSRNFGRAVQEVGRAAGASERELTGLAKAFKVVQDATVNIGRGIGDFARSLGLGAKQGSGMIKILTGLRTGMIAFQVATFGLIGAIVTLVALPLVLFFSRSREGLDKLKNVIAGARAVINEVVDRLAAIGGALAKGDIRGAIAAAKNLTAGLKEIGEAAAESAQKIRDLAREAKIIDVDEANVALRVAELKALAEDITASESSRVEAIRQIAREEERIINDRIKNQEELLAALTRTLTATDIENQTPEAVRANEELVKLYGLQADRLNLQNASQKKINQLLKDRKKDIEEISEAQKGSLNDLRARLTEIEALINNAPPDDPLFQEWLQEAIALREEIEDIEGLIASLDLVPGSRRQVEAQIRIFQDIVDNLPEDSPLLRETVGRIAELKEQLEELEEATTFQVDEVPLLDTLTDTEDVAAGILSVFANLSQQSGDELRKLRDRIPTLGLDEALEETFLKKIQEALAELELLGTVGADAIDQIRNRLNAEGQEIDGGIFGKLFGATPEEAERIKAELESLLNTVTGAIDAITEQQIASLDKRIDAQQKRVDDAVKIADRGNAELLEAEEDKLAKLQEMRERAVRRQQQLAAIQIAVNQAIAVSEAIKAIASAASFGPAAPFIIAANIAAIIAGIAAATIALNNAFGDLPTFFEGAERVADRLKFNAKVIDMTRGKDRIKGPSGRDRVLARVSVDERILSAEQNKPLLKWGVKNKDIPDLVGIALGKIAVGQTAPVNIKSPVWKIDNTSIHSDAYLLRMEIKNMIKEQKNTRRALEDLDIRTGVNKDVIYALIQGRNQSEAYRKRLIG